jgi:hypothetical protein
MTLVMIFSVPLGAYCADRLGEYRQWLMIGFSGLAILLYPLYLLMQQSVNSCYWAFMILALVESFVVGPIVAFVVMQFPMSIRYSGFAMVHGAVFALVAGTSPLVLNGLSYRFGPLAPAWYGIAALIVAVAVLRTCRAGGVD